MASSRIPALLVVALCVGCSATAVSTHWGDAGPDATGSGSDSGGSSGGGGSGSNSSSGGSGSGSSSSGAGSGSGSSSSGSSGGSGSTGSGSSGSGSSSSGSSGSGSGSSGSGSSGGTEDAGDPLAAARAQCVQIINQDRATLSPPSPPLTEATSEESCVDGQAQADYAANTPHAAFGQCQEYAQDECPGWPGPPSSIMTGCLAQMWAEGPPPRARTTTG